MLALIPATPLLGEGVETQGWCEPSCKNWHRPGSNHVHRGQGSTRAMFILETPVLLNILASMSPQINKLRDEYK